MLARHAWCGTRAHNKIEIESSLKDLCTESDYFDYFDDFDDLARSY